MKVNLRFLPVQPLHTFSKWFDCDDLAAIPAARRCHCHHPDAVLPVPTQILYLVEEFVWSSVELADHLSEVSNVGGNLVNENL